MPAVSDGMQLKFNNNGRGGVEFLCSFLDSAVGTRASQIFCVGGCSRLSSSATVSRMRSRTAVLFSISSKQL
eukprot:6209658-Pleurochrysis_carterae.AAC.4